MLEGCSAREEGPREPPARPFLQARINPPKERLLPPPPPPQATFERPRLVGSNAAAEIGARGRAGCAVLPPPAPQPSQPPASLAPRARSAQQTPRQACAPPLASGSRPCALPPSPPPPRPSPRSLPRPTSRAPPRGLHPPPPPLSPPPPPGFGVGAGSGCRRTAALRASPGSEEKEAQSGQAPV